MVNIGNSGGFWYRQAEKCYNYPDRVGKLLDIDNPKSGNVARWFKKETKAAFDYDFSHFAKLDMGKVKSLIAEPPKGALLFLLYPATVGPRLYRAYQRGKENHDYREVWDVLRRDITAITFLVYALPLIVRSLSGMVQKKSQVNLIDKKHADKVLAYSQFRNYEIESSKVLQAVLAEGNGQGLLNAVKKLNDGGLKTQGFYGPLDDTLKAMKDSVQALVHAHKPGLKGHEANSEKLAAMAKNAFKHFEVAEEQAIEALKVAKNTDNATMMKIAKNLQGEFKGVLKNYAKVRRLPSDMVSFAIIIGLIGWFPVWFNNLWNKWQFEKKVAAEQQKLATSSGKPGLAPPEVDQNSVLFHGNRSFAAANWGPHQGNPSARVNSFNGAGLTRSFNLKQNDY